MSNNVHPLLAQLYNSEFEKQAAAEAELEKIAGPEAKAILDELVKQAEAEGIDLEQVDSDAIAGLVLEALAGDVEKTAGESIPDAPGADLPAGVDYEKVAAADYLGRVQAHAYVDELSRIYGEQQGQEKVASLQDLDANTFEKLAQYLALDILDTVGALEDPSTIQSVRSREKVASIDMDEDMASALLERAGVLLHDKGWPVGEIAQVLEQLAQQ